MGKVDMMKTGLALVSHLEPILKEIISIKGKQTHGKHEIIELKEKKLSVVVYREYFENESDAEHFKNFCDRVYAISKGQLPPINSLAIMFKMIYPILQPEKMYGKQTHGKPELKKTDDGKYAIVMKEIFSNKTDAEKNLAEAVKLQSVNI